MIDDYGNNVQFLKMPVPELVTPNEDGSYTIFLKANMSDEKTLEAYKHALKHITDDDFYKADVNDIESHAHGRDRDVG